ncbi:MAG: hypothetical protein ACR2QW_13485 [bacterium]
MKHNMRKIKYFILFVMITPFFSAICFSLYTAINNRLDFEIGTFFFSLVFSTTIIYLKVFLGPLMVLARPDYHSIAANFSIAPLLLTAILTILTEKGIPFLRITSSFITAAVSCIYGVMFWWVYILLFGPVDIETTIRLTLIEVAPAAFLSGLACAALSKAPNKHMQTDRQKATPFVDR